MKKWYKVTYEGGWVKCANLDEVISLITTNEYYKGKVRRVIEVEERDIDLETLKEDN